MAKGLRQVTETVIAADFLSPFLCLIIMFIGAGTISYQPFFDIFS